MRVGAFGRTELRIHPLIVVVAAAACVLGRLGDLMQAALALTLHEFSHAIVAYVFGCPVRSIEIMPFGGVARLERGALPPHTEMCVAAAGPAASFFAAGLTAMCGELFPGTAGRLHPFLAFNLTLALTNLLPALPLDGGRMLRALLQNRMSYGSATRLAAWFGVAGGCGMLAFAIWCAVRGAYNLTLPTLGVFLLLAAVMELRALPEERMGAYLNRYDGMHAGRTYDVHHVAAHASMRTREALSVLRLNRYNVLRVVDGQMRTVGEIDEGMLLRAVAEGRGNEKIGALLSFDRHA